MTSFERITLGLKARLIDRFHKVLEYTARKLFISLSGSASCL
jgi:hypothetical protein